MGKSARNMLSIADGAESSTGPEWRVLGHRQLRQGLCQRTMRRKPGEEGKVSLIDRMIAYASTGDWANCQAYLAAHPPGDAPEEQSSHATWSVRAEIGLHRLDDALHRLDATAGNFQCRCGLSYLRSEIYWLKGEQSAAIEALRSAPWSEEMDSFPALAKETMFLYCYFLSKAGREAPPKLVQAIPEDYHAILFDGSRVGKADLLAAIEQNQKHQQSRTTA